MEMIIVGPVGHEGRSGEPVHLDGREMEYKGFRFIGRAKRGPIGWIGELTVLFPQGRSPMHAILPIPRLHPDPLSAIREAHLQGILRVDRGDIVRF